MSSYTQLTQEERYQIAALMKAGHSLSEIVHNLRRSKSTISREIRRNKGLRGYRPRQAHRLAQERRRAKCSPRIPEETWQWVERLLREDWSPEQISLWLAREKRLHVSHERIYQYILQDKRAGGDLHTHLRCQKPRRKRYGSYDRRGRIPDQKSIEERPAVKPLNAWTLFCTKFTQPPPQADGWRAPWPGWHSHDAGAASAG